jgi:hypothetical protein
LLTLANLIVERACACKDYGDARLLTEFERLRAPTPLKTAFKYFRNSFGAEEALVRVLTFDFLLQRALDPSIHRLPVFGGLHRDCPMKLRRYTNVERTLEGLRRGFVEFSAGANIIIHQFFKGGLGLRRAFAFRCDEVVDVKNLNYQSAIGECDGLLIIFIPQLRHSKKRPQRRGDAEAK